MSDVIISSFAVTGAVSPPPSKSEAHRALIAAALAGAGTIQDLPQSADIEATRRAVSGLGVCVEDIREGVSLSRRIPSLAGEVEVDCGECGTTLRLICLLYTSASGSTSQLWPEAWDGSTTTGRWDSFLRIGTAEMSSVLRVMVSKVRIPRSHRITPVSYTHLDVYKRQRCGNTPAGWIGCWSCCRRACAASPGNRNRLIHRRLRPPAGVSVGSSFPISSPSRESSARAGSSCASLRNR